MGIVIREAVREDTPEIIGIATERNVRNGREKGFLVARPTGDDVELCDRRYIAEDKGSIVGFALFCTPVAFERKYGHRLKDLYKSEDLDSLAWFGYLIAIRGSEAGRNVGGHLLRRAFDDAREESVGKIYAEVVRGNPTLDYYLCNGWNLTGKSRDYLGGFKVDLIEMNL